jgi:ATP/maltotriose-dependent transcriptional regulator MalT
MFRAVLDNTETAMCVVDLAGRAVFMNPSARRLLDAGETLPPWAMDQLGPMLAYTRTHGGQQVEKWAVGDQILRARLRPLNDQRTLMLLEIGLAHAGTGRQIEQTLARSFDLSLSDARMLAFVWRGMSNDHICAETRMKLGTVKSRLSRMYRRLGVKRRSAAVARAAEALM